MFLLKRINQSLKKPGIAAFAGRAWQMPPRLNAIYRQVNPYPQIPFHSTSTPSRQPVPRTVIHLKDLSIEDRYG